MPTEMRIIGLGDLVSDMAALMAETERLRAEKIELLTWLNTHYPHVAIAWAQKPPPPPP